MIDHDRPIKSHTTCDGVGYDNFDGYNAMTNEYFKAGDLVLWCGLDIVEIVDISGEWATIRFPDTHSTTITNTKHLDEV
jgi:hypothetical protein